jgi:hypothetical protein
MVNQVPHRVQVVGLFMRVFTVGLNYTSLAISLNKFHVTDSIRASRVYPEINVVR